MSRPFLRIPLVACFCPAGRIVDLVTSANMTLKARRVLRDALTLPPKARADIAGTLLRSLDQDDDPGVESAWVAEVERRIHDVDSGRVKLVPWTQVRRRLQTTLRRGRSKA